MSLLEANKRSEKTNKTVVATSRITEKEYKDFKELCDRTGFSVSEAIRVLIQGELNPETPKRAEKPAQRKPAPVVAPVVAVENTEEASPEYSTPAPKSFNPKSRPIRSNFGRFTTEKWKVENFLPCPICNTWVSSSNFSRHVKTNHNNMTSEELFTQYEAEADQMVADRNAAMQNL